jgi:hypothetical protein
VLEGAYLADGSSTLTDWQSRLTHEVANNPVSSSDLQLCRLMRGKSLTFWKVSKKR